MSFRYNLGSLKRSKILWLGGKRFLSHLLILGLLFSSIPAGFALESEEEPFIRYQEPNFLTFDELKSLSQNPFPRTSFKKKLETFWKTPLISNEAYYEGATPRQHRSQIGPFIRLASWNIEKSINMRDVIATFTNEKKFERLVDFTKTPDRSMEYYNLICQRRNLAAADIIILQEMDIGIKRSGYVNAAGELAKALNMNYAYGPSQLEIDPVILGLEKVYLENGVEDKDLMRYFAADPEKYKGVFGSAVLSRYPIKRAEVFQLKNQPYDWYWQEKKKPGFLESARRTGAYTFFRNEVVREMKVGGRIYFRVDLEVPELPEKTLTIINVHLEIKCGPKGRETQVAEILSYIKSIRNPVILVGDFNSAPTDLSATSVSRVVNGTIKDPTTWLGVGVSLVFPYAILINGARQASNLTKNMNDPLATNMKVVAPNPLKPLFNMIKDFKFLDGGIFDFRGDFRRSINASEGMLANSNQRGKKGFKSTFSVRQPLGGLVGKYRLDWIFVKSYWRGTGTASYRLAPHFGETLEEMNMNLKVPISDHYPNIVDLPLEEPKL